MRNLSDSIGISKPNTIISLRKTSDSAELRPILKKTVSFTAAAKESRIGRLYSALLTSFYRQIFHNFFLGSPDVTSTSNIPDVTLESDRLAMKRKQSALARLGPMAKFESTEVSAGNSVLGERKQLVITRVGDRKVVVQKGAKPAGITSRLGPKKVEVAEASSTSTTSVFSRLGRK